MDFDQFARLMRNVGEELPNTFLNALFNAAQIVLEEVKSDSRFPVASGALKSSLVARIVDDSYLGISMNDYGWYQNYGVKGTNNQKTQQPVNQLVKDAGIGPEDGDYYKFTVKDGKAYGVINQSSGFSFGVRRSIHTKGLDAKSFFDVDAVVARIVEIAEQNFEIQ